jgi:hypothetical protein
MCVRHRLLAVIRAKVGKHWIARPRLMLCLWKQRCCTSTPTSSCTDSRTAPAMQRSRARRRDECSSSFSTLTWSALMAYATPVRATLERPRLATPVACHILTTRAFARGAGQGAPRHSLASCPRLHLQPDACPPSPTPPADAQRRASGNPSNFAGRPRPKWSLAPRRFAGSDTWERGWCERAISVELPRARLVVAAPAVWRTPPAAPVREGEVVHVSCSASA